MKLSANAFLLPVAMLFVVSCAKNTIEEQLKMQAESIPEKTEQTSSNNHEANKEQSKSEADATQAQLQLQNNLSSLFLYGKYALGFLVEATKYPVWNLAFVSIDATDASGNTVKISADKNCGQLAYSQEDKTAYVDIAMDACPTSLGNVSDSAKVVARLAYRKGDFTIFLPFGASFTIKGYMLSSEGKDVGYALQDKYLDLLPVPGKITALCSGAYSDDCTVTVDSEGRITQFVLN